MSTEEIERNQEMRRLRYEDGKTLQEIADMYGISRERIRQIIGNTGKYFRRNWTEESIKSGKVKLPTHWKELKDMQGLVKSVVRDDWGNHYHESLSGNARIHHEFQERAIEIFNGLGFEVKRMPFKHDFNLLLNNKIRVSVRVTHTNLQTCPSQTSITYPMWAVPNLDNCNECDFYFVFIPSGNDYTYFVIPAKEVRGLAGDAKRIRIPWPILSNKKSKWHQYHQKIDLLL